MRFLCFLDTSGFKVCERNRFWRLTSVVRDPRHHDPGPDPVLQRQRPGHGGRLQVLRVRMAQLREAGVGESRVLPPQGRQGVHGGRVQPRDGAQSRVREAQDARRFGDEPGLELRAPRGRGVRPAAGERAARRAVAAQAGGRVSAAPVRLIREQRVDSEVFGLLHGDRSGGEGARAD